MRRTRLMEFIALLLLAPAAIACLWDYDTLGAEARGRPGVAEVLVGWIDRWPDEVYEVRLERRSALLEEDSSNLDAYDDAGVACDRLGRHDEAIAWMLRKREALDVVSAFGTPDEEHEYRYHANLGTFHVHRWIVGGADRSDMADVEAAREHIARAIEINPEAHFGREVVQLRLIDMIEANEHLKHEMDDSAWGDGLLGLIELGDAWGSMDVFARLHETWGLEHGAFAALAAFRVEELDAAGRSPLIADWRGIFHMHYEDDGTLEVYLTIPDDTVPKVRSWFEKARGLADARNSARRAYILEQMNDGAHPDDVEWDVFFAGWEEPEFPEMPDSLLPQHPAERAGIYAMGALGVLVLIIGAFIVLRIQKSRA